MLYSLGALNTFLITSLFSLLFLCGLVRQNLLGSDKERGRDVYSQVTRKSRIFFLFIYLKYLQPELEGDRGGWSLEVLICFFLKTLVFAKIQKDFMVPKCCLAQDDA